MKDHRFPRSHGSLLDLAIPALRANYDPVTVLQIGANDGVLNDPLHSHLLKGGCRGVRMEPTPAIFDLLKEYCANLEGIAVANIAVSDHEGMVALYVPGDQPERAVHQNASLHSKRLKNEGFKEESVCTISVKCTTVSDIFNTYLDRELHLLVIDTEGHDFRILESCLNDNIEPSVIFFEVVHLCRLERIAYRELLADKGYYYVEDIKDCLAVKRNLLV